MGQEAIQEPLQQNTRILNKKTEPFEREDDDHYQKTPFNPGQGGD